MANQTYDIVIVGSGIAAAVAAEQALKRGRYKILILEAGPNIVMRNRRIWLDAVMTNRLPHTALNDTPKDYTATGVDPWKIEGGRMFGRGGSTIHWGGWCPRQMPEDFTLRTNTGRELDWPYSYKELEPYYGQAEHWIGVAGDSQSGSRAWRSGPYPFEAPVFTEPDGVVIEAFKQLDITYEHAPLSRFSKPSNGRPACQTFGTCKYCPIGARFTGDQGLARVEDNVEIRLNAPVTEIVMANKSMAAGVKYVQMPSGQTVFVEAPVIWLCAGALEIPKLLLNSKTRDWPNGIGNDNDLVGRYLVANPFLYLRATRASNPMKLQEELNFPTLLSRYWDTPAQQQQGKFILNSRSPYLKIGDQMIKMQTAEQIRDKVVGEVKFELQGAMQTLGFYENRVLPAAGATRFGLSRTRIETPKPMMDQQAKQQYLGAMKTIAATMGYTVQDQGSYPQRGDHAMCTTRMGMDPSTSVVDSATLAIHGVDNLAVFSNSIFPSGSPANPTLTLVAALLKAFDGDNIKLS